MHNDLFTIGKFTIHGYGLMIGIGFAAAVLFSSWRAKKKGLSDDAIYTFAILCMIFGFLGAKILYCIVEFPSMIENPLLALSGGGFVVYGGLIGAAIAVYLYCRIKKMSFLPYVDLVLPSVALAQGFGRIGCFLAGCCYGRETDSWIGIAFHDSALAPNNVKLIPTQLISSAASFALFGILMLYGRKERRVGRVGAMYIILYSIGRFLIEFLRNDYRGTVFNVLSTSQFIGIFTLILGLAMYFCPLDKLFSKDKLVEAKAENGENVEEGVAVENDATKEVEEDAVNSDIAEEVVSNAAEESDTVEDKTSDKE